ncbi:hypothetical protein HDU76_000030 [Blyttiomyces sp. JEL0837]|nr:hypothetical protein HDU76_000030 [Blyttiomyces sp. JEL0837]
MAVLSTRRVNRLIIRLIIITGILYPVIHFLVRIVPPQNITISSDADPSHQHPLPPPSRRRSTIDCNWSAKTCLITNLHFIDGKFHVYMGTGFNTTGWEDVTMVTGIGWGTGFLRFHPDSFTGKVEYDDLKVGLVGSETMDLRENDGDEGEGGSKATTTMVIEPTKAVGNVSASGNTALEPVKYVSRNTRTFKLPIYMHVTDPPSYKTSTSGDKQSTSKTSSAQDSVPTYRVEPTVLFSVMWPNLFRTIYAGVAAWCSLMSHRVFFPDHFSMVLLDRDPKPTAFLPILHTVSADGHNSEIGSGDYTGIGAVQWLDGIIDKDMPRQGQKGYHRKGALSDTVFKAAVVGLSRDALVAEIDLEKGDEWGHRIRRAAFRSFCDTLKERVLGRKVSGAVGSNRQGNGGTDLALKPLADVDAVEKVDEPTSFWSGWGRYFQRGLKRWAKPKVTLILRDGKIRKILNEKEVIALLKALPVKLSVYQFGTLTLKQQIEIVDSTDIFITMHGAALTHILFLRPGAHVIELFPFAFRKVIYQNLARILGVKYLFWQNTRISDTVFNWKFINENRVTDMPLDRVSRLPINWYNMDSKNFWRNQDTNVNLVEFANVVKTAIRSHHDGLTIGPKTKKGHTRYLMFMPWEQVNNQIVGLKSACALANMLDRTLVLPHLGYRKPSNGKKSNTDNGSGFNVRDFYWKPIERYYDLEQLIEHLPCNIITFNNFVALNEGQNIGILRYHHLGDGVTSEDQQLDYYKRVAGLSFKKLEWDMNVYYQLNRQDLINLHGKDTSRVLALGSMFWYYDFGIKQSYPLTKYYDYMANPTYHQITRGLVFNERIRNAVDEALNAMGLGDGGFVAIHVRRGDYKEKCRDLRSVVRRQLENGGDFADDQTSNDEGMTPLQREERAYASCATDIRHVQNVLESNRHHFENDTLDMSRMTIYVMTNLNSAAKTKDDEVEREPDEFDHLRKSWGRVLFHRDVVARAKKGVEDLDKIDLGMFDQFVGMRAKFFAGNLHSSFSRHIIEGRQVDDGMTSHKSDAVGWTTF